MQLQPTKLSKTEDGKLVIEWSSVGSREYTVANSREYTVAERREYTVRELRDACPCATCREKRAAPAPSSPFTVLSAAELKPLTLNGMKPVGNYAYSIAFSDGHDTGIYTLELLRELGKAV